MDDKIEKKIILEYKNGKSSIDIVKIVGLSKPTILKVLNKHNLIRKRDRCSSLNIKKDGDKYYVLRKCPSCENEIKTYSKDKVIACRNHFNKINNKSLCRTCMGKNNIGEGNPFFGKKHSNKSKKKISESRRGKAIGDKNGMFKKENRDKIGNKLIERIKINPIKYSKVSKLELSLLKMVSKQYPDAIGSYNVDRYICDIFIPSLNLIIEFNGDYWHCNPNKYDKDYYHIIKQKKSKDIWEEDRIRVDNIKKNGYNLEVIWECDLKTPYYLNTILKKYERKD
jgi:G:T-mismatch repair DNA endonuclease (very short patch repair protein)